MRLSLGGSMLPVDVLRAVTEAVGADADLRFFCLDGGGEGEEFCTWVADLEVGGKLTSVTGVINSQSCEVIAVKPPVC